MNNKSDYFLWRILEKHLGPHPGCGVVHHLCKRTTNREVVANHLAYTHLYMFLVAALICLSNLYLSVNDEIIAKQS